MAIDPSKIEQEYLAAYENFSDQIFRYCLIQTSNRETAKDLTQDTFMRAWEYLRQGKASIEYMKAFLYKIATNLIIDYRRKKKPTSSIEGMMEEEGFDIPSGEREREKMEGAIEIENMMQVLGGLDEKYRDVLTMRFINDLSLSEIAEATGESENNVSVRLHRAIEKLRRLAGSEPRPEASGLKTLV